MDLELLAGLVSFAAMIIVWAVAPSKPTQEAVVEAMPAPAPREAIA